MNLWEHKKYDRATRKTVRREIKVQLEAGKTSAEAAEYMSKAGYKKPDGKPIDTKFILNQRRFVNTRSLRRRRPTIIESTTTKKPNNDVLALVQDILTNPSLNDQKRVKVLSALIE